VKLLFLFRWKLEERVQGRAKFIGEGGLDLVGPGEDEDTLSTESFVYLGDCRAGSGGRETGGVEEGRAVDDWNLAHPDRHCFEGMKIPRLLPSARYLFNLVGKRRSCQLLIAQSMQTDCQQMHPHQPRILLDH
jgi:hypothetical protein